MEYTIGKGITTEEVIDVGQGLAWPEWYKFRPPFTEEEQELYGFEYTGPTKTQMEALRKSFPLDEFAYIMDMGTGKSFVAINYMVAGVQCNRWEAMLIVPETGGKPVWKEQFEMFCPVPYDMFIMESGAQNAAHRWMDQIQMRKRPWDSIPVLVVGVESLSTGPYATEVATRFSKEFKCYMTIDESSSIKNPIYKKRATRKSRTHVCWDLGAEAEGRSILNGTPIDEGIEDFFAQFRFLNGNIIGSKNFYAFRAKYCRMGGFEMRKIIGYYHLDEFFARINPFLYTVKIEDVEDMPDQLYEQVYIEPTPQMKKALKDLGDPMMTTRQGDKELECESVLERMTRYQQIIGGYFPYDLPPEDLIDRPRSKGTHDIVKLDGRNPKMEALFETVDKLGKRKVVIWARFSRERIEIVEQFAKRYPGQFVHMGSGLDADEKKVIKDKFQQNKKIRFLITSQQIAAKAQTFTAATAAIYYSNSFSWSQRLQSERRIWRKGQKHPCLYIDIMMNAKIDKQILKALRDKKDISDFVMEQIS